MMPCGHPLAARQIVADPLAPTSRFLITRCWACAVEAELVSKIVGPEAAAKRREYSRDV